MKKLLICLFVAFYGHSIQAQENSPLLKFGTQLTITPYNDFLVGGAVVQYDRPLSGRWSLGAALGFAGARREETIFTRGFNDGVNWDTSYQYDLHEHFAQLDAQVFYSLTNNADQNLKLGIGLSGLLTRFHHADDIGTKEGVIWKIGYRDKWTPSLMLNLALDYDVSMGERWLLHFKGIFRTQFQETAEVDIDIENEFGTMTSSYAVLSNVALSVGVGYRLQ